MLVGIMTIGGTSIAVPRPSSSIDGAENRGILVHKLLKYRAMVEARELHAREIRKTLKAREVRETLQDAEELAAEALEILGSEPPTLAPSTSAPAGAISDAAFAGLLRAAGFPDSVIPTMVSIGHRESGLCPTAVNSYGCAGAGHAYAGGPACGLLQLYPCPGPHALDPATNVRLAYQKYAASGLSPWGM